MKHRMLDAEVHKAAEIRLGWCMDGPTHDLMLCTDDQSVRVLLPCNRQDRQGKVQVDRRTFYWEIGCCQHVLVDYFTAVHDTVMF